MTEKTRPTSCAWKVWPLSAWQEGKDNFAAAECRGQLKLLNGGTHMAASPSEADVILFVEHHPGQDPLFLRVLLHPLRRQYPRKCVLYHDGDYSACLMPSIGPSVLRSFAKSAWAESWFYVTQFVPNPYIEFAVITSAQWLFSFQGAVRTHPIRRAILNLKCGEAFLDDTSAINAWEVDDHTRDQYQKRYAALIKASKFVLCPRGIGPASYRLQEVMKAGRVPVIVSDAWVPPAGPCWSEFSIRIAECDVHFIPEILKKREAQAVPMGIKARLAWEKYCAPENRFTALLGYAGKIFRSNSGNHLSDISKGWIKVFGSKAGLRALLHSIRGLSQKSDYGLH